MNSIIPRSEHPRPQFLRDKWINLNGEWTFEFDFGLSGSHAGRELFKSQGFARNITVPFCPESELSGVGYKDFIPAMWYHRKLLIPKEWTGKNILLHFGGVDYESEIYINGKSIKMHIGGSSSFTVEITGYIEPDCDANLVVRVKDDGFRGNDYHGHGGGQPAGKQSGLYKSHGCMYTRTTGIWQTVWMEAVDKAALKDAQVITDIDNQLVTFIPSFYNSLSCGYRFSVGISSDGQEIACTEVSANDGILCSIALPDPQLWTPETPFLYDVHYTLLTPEGEVADRVDSYFGMRKVHCENGRVLLNNKPIYLRLVLDQGFYPDGIWTAPSDEALKNDILLSMKAGFNGARLHQKVFEEGFHYWADKLGYLTWGEFASWGADPNSPVAQAHMLSEWRQIIVRDRNHPSIIGWTPWNETHTVTNNIEHTQSHVEAYELTRALDSTRPINDASGYVHRKTDLWTVHHYEQNPQKLKESLKRKEDGSVFRNYPDKEWEYEGQPYLVDEFGGIKWIPENEEEFADNSWGYGTSPRTLEEFYNRLEGQVQALLDIPHICGYCYTQLTDVEQEQNGIYNYDRSEKFDMSRVHNVFSSKAF